MDASLRSPLPVPPLALLHRTGHMGDDDPVGAYDRMGVQLRGLIESTLPEDWSWTGRRVLDFGCGAGRALRHFAAEAQDTEFWGCDIDASSVEWVDENLCPPFHVIHCSESPGLPQADGYFDLIYAISVYTHITDNWADWLLEHHRLLKEGGLLLASFLGEGMIEQLIGEQWNEDEIGMNALLAGKPWDVGGPIALHSPWWLRAHWGRAFDVMALTPHTGGDRPAGHGLILLRRKPVRLTAADLTKLEKDEPREITALQRHVRQLRHETSALRGEDLALRRRLQEAGGRKGATLQQLEEEVARQNALLARLQRSASWRLTAPLRAIKRSFQ